jgi:hypothetical protein
MGEVFDVVLAENPTTGYRWILDVSPSQAIVLVSDEFDEFTVSGEGIGTGAAAVSTPGRTSRSLRDHTPMLSRVGISHTSDQDLHAHWCRFLIEEGTPSTR